MASRWRSNVLTLVYILSLLNGSHARSQAPLDMHSPPKFLPGNKNYTYKVGQVAELECPVTNLGNKQVVWRLASNDTIFTIGYQKFHEDPRYEAKMSNGVWVLVIHDVQVKDMGMYECQVSSVEKHLRYYVTLIVTEPPVVQKPNIQISGTSFVNENEKIRLVCNATGVGYTPEEIDWFRDGNSLQTDESQGLYIVKSVEIGLARIHSTLEIKQAKMKDMGVYVCRTSNLDVTSIHVNVLNGDSYNVKRESKGAVTQQQKGDGHNSGSRLHVTSLLMGLTFLLITSYCLCSLDLT